MSFNEWVEAEKFRLKINQNSFYVIFKYVESELGTGGGWSPPTGQKGGK